MSNLLGRSTSISLNNSQGIITLNDGLAHKYFTSLKWEKDNNVPVGFAQAKTLYQGDILKYWSSYNGPIVIHAQLTKREENDMVMNTLPNTSLQTKQIQQANIEVDEDNKIRIDNSYYNYSFIGKVSKVRQVGQNIVIKFEDLGWKFLQKVPKEFRDTYIAGQTLDNAFQAMCEFMGVDFAYSIEDLNQYSFGADGYSIEKDGQVIEEVPTILSEYEMSKEAQDETTSKDEDLANALQETGNELGSLPSSNVQQSLQNDNQANTQNQENSEEEQEEDTSDLDSKLEQYEEEFNNKIKDLFIGNTIYNSNVTDAILNYDAITITPTVTSNASTSNDISGTDSSSDTSDNSNDTTSSPISNVPQPTSRAIAAHNKKKIYLNQTYINSLPPQQAAEKAKQTNTYSEDTLKRLRRRAIGLWW